MFGQFVLKVHKYFDVYFVFSSVSVGAKVQKWTRKIYVKALVPFLSKTRYFKTADSNKISTTGSFLVVESKKTGYTKLVTPLIIRLSDSV